MKRSLALLLMAPVMGGLFVVFLPLIGFALFGYVAAMKLASFVQRALFTEA